MEEPEYDTIERSERLRLEHRDRLLSALEAAGVDNWEFYSDIVQILSGNGDD